MRLFVVLVYCDDYIDDGVRRVVGPFSSKAAAEGWATNFVGVPGEQSPGWEVQPFEAPSTE